MRFIFPKNYKYKAKILGFIDYITAIFDLIIGIILFTILNMIINSIETKLYIFIILYVPIVLFSVLGSRWRKYIGVFYMYI